MTKAKNKKALAKKAQVQEGLLRHCLRQGDHAFDNALVKKISEKVGFGNPFDVTKVDSSAKLAPAVRKKDMFILHLGGGRHKFVRGVANGYHAFEPISSAHLCEWAYQPSLLNEHDTSESNILSVALNQKITHHFLYGDKDAVVNAYQSRRTHGTFSYRVGEEKVRTSRLQMEIDQTLERDGVVTIVEAKNGFPEDFAVYQIYIPFLHFVTLKEKEELPIKKINCCYLLRDQADCGSVIRLYLYTFADVRDMASIQLEKCAEYRLVKT